MKLKDEGTMIDTLYRDTLFFNLPCHVLKVKYEAESWQYYINKESYKLEGFRFEFNNGSGKGEIIRNIGEYDWKGIRIPQKRVWYTLQDSLLGTDIVVE